MCFFILPELDPVRGILLLNGLAITPAVLFILCGSNVKRNVKDDQDTTAYATPNSSKRKTRTCFVVHSILDILVAVVQVSVVPLTFLFVNFPESPLYLTILQIVGMVLVSCTWWENFVDDRFCCKRNWNTGILNYILAIRYDLQESRPIVTIFTSIVKIGITVLAAWVTTLVKPISNEEESQHLKMDNVTLKEAFSYINNTDFKDYSAIVSFCLTAFVGHYVGYIACKLKMQRFSFCIPLLLSTPISVALVKVNCYRDLFSPFTTEVLNPCRNNDGILTTVLIFVTGGFLWLSLYWLGRYTWTPWIESLAREERYVVASPGIKRTRFEC